MTQDDYQLRFGGISRLYGQQQTQWLQQAHFCVIGIGGVGSWVAEALARTGVGQLTLIDLDDICVTNSNRQIHAHSQSVGEAKVEAMKARCQLINPQITVHVIDDFITMDNIREHIQGFDYVIDAIDAVKEKAALIAHCKRNKLPIITTGGAGGQTDPSEIKFGDVAKTTHDPLLAKVRYLLRKQYNFSNNPKRKFDVDCVYSTEQLVYPDGHGQVCRAKQGADSTMNMDCANGFGSATMVTGSFGFFAAAKAVRKYLNKRQRLSEQSQG
ncbi:tRNA cyclic N6-threonylcarbamoyladenosine(37) synthase TcdA [Pseudoalteromonas ruthenica]|uniref:tRNA cyclic N6-threonylcarbamoyladenosine(37) synthase TcdA n=1 Tax=Pseudoalteromonas ruthenica TaxID=151081 RepID=UPI00110B10A2|nr:tRNA cyclic N6-threonylcarbamoyladenosine(37) synthase TcdA [Pseudoalteromonas ruthenica]TMO47187.1 tRNA cyclic N6-threonylcarbamoyladenosine(37) synthase TcdA [Pseudoalteromonas ruthenica]TMO51361.1 tRNA cyclic N6-threonylcarbamoyladenosine(37) synthase TcdA [Pseudoalteromonas ruthenica]